MGTRGIIGIPTATGFRGRYVHWDAYPNDNGVGASLCKVIERDGFKLAVETLTEKFWGWSTMTGAAEPFDNHSGVVVPGYGVAYTDQRDEWWTEADNGGCEWAYGMTPDHIEVWHMPINGNHWIRCPDIPVTTSRKAEQ